MAEVEPFTDTDDDQQERPEPAEPKKTEDNLLKKAIEVLTKGVERAGSPSSVKPNEARDSTLGPLNIPKPTNPK
jgi:transglutaminase/protease-like cytokinesis protein 3